MDTNIEHILSNINKLKVSVQEKNNTVSELTDKINELEEDVKIYISLNNNIEAIQEKILAPILGAFSNNMDRAFNDFKKTIRFSTICSSILAVVLAIISIYIGYMINHWEKRNSDTIAAIEKQNKESNRMITILKESMNIDKKIRIQKLVGDGDKQYDAKQFKSALESYEAAIELNPDNNELCKKVEEIRKILQNKSK